MQIRRQTFLVTIGPGLRSDLFDKTPETVQLDYLRDKFAKSKKVHEVVTGRIHEEAWEKEPAPLMFTWSGRPSLPPDGVEGSM